MPVLAVGAEHLADHVHGEVIDHAGHWLVNEQPAALLHLLRTFLT